MIIIYPPKIYPVPIREIGQEITPYSSIWLELFTTNSNSTHNTTYSEDPVSDRNIISDHATNEPLEITEEITLYDDPSTYSFIGQQALAEDEEFSKVVWEYLEMLRINFAVMKVRTHEGIYESMTIRKSHKNPDILALYKDYLEKPNSQKAHHLLHTHYHSRNK